MLCIYVTLLQSVNNLLLNSILPTKYFCD